MVFVEKIKEFAKNSNERSSTELSKLAVKMDEKHIIDKDANMFHPSGCTHRVALRFTAGEHVVEVEQASYHVVIEAYVVTYKESSQLDSHYRFFDGVDATIAFIEQLVAAAYPPPATCFFNSYHFF